MSKEELKKSEEDDEGDLTSPEKAENEEYRNFKEEPGDDDGENRHPEERNSMLYTSLLVFKGMIGAGILNLPLIFKTLGIIGGIIVTTFFIIIASFAAYFLARSKDITQRYSYAVYSKLALGTTGTVLIKFSLVVMCSTLAIVQLIVFGDIFKGLSLLFCDINLKVLIIIIGLVLMPFMFQKDISGITKYAYFGVIGLGIFFGTNVILFIHKYYKNQLFVDKSMLYPNGSFKELFQCVGGYYNAFTFHMAYFPYYLPLKPRNTKTMMKSVIIGTTAGGLVYSLYGILFFLMYGNQISDSALKYLQKDLAEAHKNHENGMVFVFVISFLSFMLNASISTMTHFYVCKSHFIGLIKFALKKLADREKNAKKDIPLVDIKDERKFSDDVQSIPVKEKELLSSRKQFYITFCCYLYALIMAVSFDKIIILDSFNGSTVASYINLIAPSIFYLYFSRGKNYYWEKIVAILILIFGVVLVLLFFILSFY